MSIDSSSSCFSLPEELLIEILVCLPIRTLLRFKSVSKSWLALIDSSEFIDRHMFITTTDNNNNSSSSSKHLGPFIFLSNNLHTKNYEISWNFFSISGNHEFQVIEDLGTPPCYSKPISSESLMNSTMVNMVGSCNGVICLYDDLLKDVSLWNPAIHQFRHLPKSSLIFGKTYGIGYRDFIGFGFDLETKDYKVVLVVADPPPDIIHRVEVYSLSTDSWRTLEEDVVVPADPWNFVSDNGGYLNGRYYGLGTKNVLRSSINDISFSQPFFDVSEDAVSAVWELFSFDFTKEIFKFLQLPDGMHDNMCPGFHDLGLILFGEKVTIIHCHMSYSIHLQF